MIPSNTKISVVPLDNLLLTNAALGLEFSDSEQTTLLCSHPSGVDSNTTVLCSPRPGSVSFDYTCLILSLIQSLLRQLEQCLLNIILLRNAEYVFDIAGHKSAILLYMLNWFINILQHCAFNWQLHQWDPHEIFDYELIYPCTLQDPQHLAWNQVNSAIIDPMSQPSSVLVTKGTIGPNIGGTLSISEYQLLTFHRFSTG